MRRGLTSAVVIVAVGLGSAACSSGRPGTVSATAAKLLERSAQQLREIAATGDVARLQIAIRNFDALVERQRRAGQVSPDRANAIEDAADGLAQYVQPSSSPSQSTTTTTTQQTSPTPSASESPSQSPSPSSSPTPSGSESSSPTIGVTVSPP